MEGTRGVLFVVAVALLLNAAQAARLSSTRIPFRPGSDCPKEDMTLSDTTHRSPSGCHCVFLFWGCFCCEPKTAPPSTAPAPSPTGTPPSSPPSVLAKPLSLSSLCNTTEQPDLCLTTLSTYPSNESTAVLQDLTAFVAEVALTLVNQTDMLAVNLSQAGNGSHGEKAALKDCLDLLDQSRDGLNDSINRLMQLDPHADSKLGVKGQVMNVRVWMSSSYTQQDTCWDGFEDAKGPIKEQMLKSGQPIAPLISMALSFAKTLEDVGLSSYYALHPSPP